MFKKPGTWLFAAGLILISVENALARAGGGMGGGFGGGGGGIRGFGQGGNSSSVWLSYLLMSLPAALGIYAWRRNVKLKATKRLLERLGRVEPVWEESLIKSYIEEHFRQVQLAWSNNDLEALRILLDERLFLKWKKKLNKIRKKWKRNKVSEIEILHIEFIDMRNYTDDSKDRFTVEISAILNDETIDHDNNVVRSENYSVIEYWTYFFRVNRFVLMDVGQINSDVKFLRPNYNETFVQ